MPRLRCACHPVDVVIDVHAHVVPKFFPPSIGRLLPQAWPSMSHPSCSHGVLQFGDKVPPRTLPAVCWDDDLRLADMQAEQVDVQVLSPMPDLFGYALPEGDAVALCRHVNDDVARWVERHPGRFLGLGMLPMQAPEAAVRELERIHAELPLQGVEIGTNVDGLPIGDARFHPVFAAAERLGLAVFVHPAKPVATAMITGPRELHSVIAFPTDSAFALASLVTGGVLLAFPRLRIGASHCGGAFGFVLPRLQHAWEQLPALREFIRVSPEEQIRSLYVDCLALSARAVRYALDLHGPDRLLLGSDHPFALGDRKAVRSLTEAISDASLRRRITRDNALAFLFAAEEPAAQPDQAGAAPAPAPPD